MNIFKLLLLPLLFLIAQPSQSVPVKVLPLGDSITHGAGYNDPHSSYRDELYDLLTGAGYEFEFVGTQSSNYNGINLDHEGISSIQADQILNGGGMYSQDSLVDKLEHYNIDIVLLHAGTNDIINNQGTDYTTRVDIENIIDVLQAKNASVTILVAKVIPIYNPDLSTGLNSLIDNNWAQTQSTDTSSIIIVDQHTGIFASDLYGDLVHPIQSGETKMAQKWFDTLILQPILANQLLISPNLGLTAPSFTIVETNIMLSASSDSNGTISYESTTPSICTVDASTVTPITVTPINAGTCNLIATQIADGEYTADTATINITVIAKTDQTVTLTTSVTSTITTTAKLGTTFTVAATSTSGLTAFTITSITPDTCTLLNNTVTTLAAGDCKLTALQSGDATYNPATSAVKTITIIKNTQTINFSVPTDATIGTNFTVNANASSSLAIKFTSKTPKICSVTATGIAKPLVAGECTLNATQAGNERFKPLTKSKTLLVKAPEKSAGAVSFIWLILLGYAGVVRRRLAHN